ncbi:MAG: hypothetical protein DWQ10_02145 [Calditrichaeota bacterium]|nr:MAG: hypothetical protein DWQ10_02145 [Calditrichota bacterium]
MPLGLFSRQRQHSSQPCLDRFDLEQSLLNFSPNDSFRIRDACEGICIFGATGSGKTSGSGAALTKAYLAHGFGGLILTAKNDERALWQNYARETGRVNDLIIFSPEQLYRFNFLEYELTRPGRGAGQTENLLNIFSSLLEIQERKSRAQGDHYWTRATRQLIRNAIDIVAIGTGSVSLPDLYQAVISAPASSQQTVDKKWQEQSFCFHCIVSGDKHEKTILQSNDFDVAARYWLSEYPALAEKTRSIIVSLFTSMSDSFLRGMLRELFCTTLTITPEQTLDGSIILCDLPVKEYGELGQYAQIIFKYLWQQAIERRIVSKNPRPVFLWCDEAQNFVSSYDREFQSTARSSRACTVYLSQNLPNYFATLGGENQGKVETEALLGNLQTKIFHSNSDKTTNEWASDLISRSYQYRHNFGASGNDRRSAQQAGVSESLDYDLLPREFSRLKTGGPDNDRVVEGIVYQSGRVWQVNRKTYLKCKFLQGNER